MEFKGGEVASVVAFSIDYVPLEDRIDDGTWRSRASPVVPPCSGVNAGWKEGF